MKLEVIYSFFLHLLRKDDSLSLEIEICDFSPSLCYKCLCNLEPICGSLPRVL